MRGPQTALVFKLVVSTNAVLLNEAPGNQDDLINAAKDIFTNIKLTNLILETEGWRVNFKLKKKVHP